MEKNITVNTPWFQSWFDTSFYHRLYAGRDENEAKNFVDNLVAELQPRTYAKMLDLGCGSGRHSRWLSEHDFDVIGIDLSASSIRTAKKFQNHALHFYRHDMRVPFGANYFDYVFNFFTSFGYFKTSDEDRKVITNISNSLKPGGTLVLDYINSVFAEARLVNTEQKEIDGIRYRISRWMDDKHFFKKIQIDDVNFGLPLEFTEQVKKFKVSEFEEMFAEAGLEVNHVYGDYSLNEFEDGSSPRMILVACKRV